MVNSDVFDTVEIQYYNKSGKLVCSQNAQVNKHELVGNIINQLQVLAQKYILHRFFVINNKVYWEKTTNYHTLWLNYSQNIAFTEKKSNWHISQEGYTHDTTQSFKVQMKVKVYMCITYLMTLTVTVC